MGARKNKHVASVKCKTCGDQRVVHFQYEDHEAEALAWATELCPDCACTYCRGTGKVEEYDDWVRDFVERMCVMCDGTGNK